MSLRTLISYLIFPALMGTLMVVAWLGIDAWDLSPAWWIPALTAGGAMSLAFLERALPYRPRWAELQDDLQTDVTHLLLSTITVPEVLKATLFGLLFGAAASLSEVVGGWLWPVSWPVAAQLALALLVADFGQYWIHRLSHTTALWRFHATHHSVPRLYFLNAARVHPVDVFLQFCAETAPLILLGCPPQVVALFVLFVSVHQMFQHANIDIRLGPLNHIFASAELHRWHHSRDLREGNNNYGANLIIWDSLFGTRYLPSDREPPEDVGLTDMPRFPRNYLGQLMSPLRWRELEEEEPDAR